MDGKQVNIDCRPSDALVLLVRARVPIFVSEEIMSTVAIQPEDRRPYDLSAEPVEDEVSDADDLSIFSDFLSTLELNKEFESSEPLTGEPPATLETDLSTEDLTDDVDEDDGDLDDDEQDIDDILFGPTINNN